MSYTLDISLALGSSKTGLSDLRAQLVDTAGSNVGSAVSAGFTEIGAGNYLWHYAAFPDAHRGGVVIYSNAAPSTVLAFVAVNPEEAENTDAKTSSVAAAVWAVSVRTLSSFGTLASDVATAVWAAAAGPLSALVAGIWSYADRSLTDKDGFSPSAAQVADAVHDEQLSGHQTAGSAGKALSDAPSAAAIAAAIKAMTIDGISFESSVEVLLAVLAGVAEVSGNTVIFKKRNGTTAKITITYGSDDGERTASAIA